ncbi:MAG: hypothetical protein AAF570_16885 [Bacteroidota bacterium]
MMKTTTKILFALAFFFASSLLLSCEKENTPENSAMDNYRSGPINDAAGPFQTFDYLPNIEHSAVFEVRLPNVTGGVNQVPLLARLRDQFSPTWKPSQVTELSFFANAIDKNDEGLIDSSAHWNWYEINQIAREPHREVTIYNQFTQLIDTMVIGQPQYLLVPATKNGQGDASSLDHYKCYEVLRAREEQRRAKLMDPCYGTDSVTVTTPLLFCPPCGKWLPGREPELIQNPVDHLTVYDIDNERIADYITTTDQFGIRGQLVLERDYLTVPTRKFSFRTLGVPDDGNDGPNDFDRD